MLTLEISFAPCTGGVFSCYPQLQTCEKPAVDWSVLCSLIVHLHHAPIFLGNPLMSSAYLLGTIQSHGLKVPQLDEGCGAPDACGFLNS